MTPTTIDIEHAASARERMNHRCRVTEFRKFGARQRYEMGAFDTLVPSPLLIVPTDCADHEERRRLKAAIGRLRRAMHAWQKLCEERFCLVPAFDDATWAAIERQAAPPAASDVPLAASDVPLAASDVPLAASDVPLAASDVPLAASDVLAALTRGEHATIHIGTIVLEQHNHGVLPPSSDNDLNLLTNG